MPLGPLALMLTSATTALAGLAIALAAGGARSRKARARLGEPLDRVPETGGAVTLRGKLAAGAPHCPRFDDGRDAAAATAASLTANAEASARAATLVLYVGEVPVHLDGPVRVIAGSREAAVGSNVAPPRGGVMERIQAVDPEIAWALWNRPSKLRLRSIAHHDRVRVSGVLKRSDRPMEGAAKGYRDAGAPWCLVPSEGGAIDVAYERAPGGPPVWRAASVGALIGALLVVIAAVRAPPALPEESGSAADAQSPVGSGSGRDRSFDGAEKALEEGDFEAASAAYPRRTTFATQGAEIALIAGRGQLAAELANQKADAFPTSTEGATCLAEALRAREITKAPVRAPNGLREDMNRSDGHRRAYCGLLLADFLEGEERAAVVSRLPPTGDGHLARLRALLLLEAGRLPDVVPRDDGKVPHAGVLLRRSPHHFHDATLALHITEAIRRHPLADRIDPHFRAIEAARAAQLLSALGDASGARRAWERAQTSVSRLDYRELIALRVAIELRAGDVTEAERFAISLESAHDMSQASAILAGRALDRSRLRDHSHAKHLWERAREAHDGEKLAAEFMRPYTPNDGEMLFLVATRVKTGRDALLAWVRTGNRERDRGDSKTLMAPHAPEDFLSRLEERRIMAAALGDAALAAALEAKLRRARNQILRREIAVARFLLHHGSLHD